MVKKIKQKELVGSGALRKAREEAMEYAIKKGMEAYRSYMPVVKRKLVCSFKKKNKSIYD